LATWTSSSRAVSPPPAWRPLVYGEDPPTAARSWNSRRDATVQPSFSAPSRFSAGITASSKYSWQNSMEPSTILICWISMPLWWMGTMNTDRPRCLGTSQLVRTSARA
jgi:hypothetical protein